MKLNRKINFCTFLLLCILIITTSCHRKNPSDVLNSSQMEDVLYDFHIAKAIASQGDSVGYYEQLYFLEVLKKHKLTEQKFEKSMVWYSQHTNMLYDIYNNIDERLKKESMALGIVNSTSNKLAQLTATGDTANIWTGQTKYLLSTVGVNNRMHFSIKADSTFLPGDRFMWTFQPNYVIASGQKQTLVQLSVVYDNDSVQETTGRIYQSNQYDLSLKTTNRPIKQINGFIYLQADYSSEPRLLFITDNYLIRYHAKEVKKEEIPASNDSINKAEPILKDSIATLEKPTLTEKRAKPVPLKKKW